MDFLSTLYYWVTPSVNKAVSIYIQVNRLSKTNINKMHKMSQQVWINLRAYFHSLAQVGQKEIVIEKIFAILVFLKKDFFDNYDVFNFHPVVRSCADLIGY